jgi:hypothetical protein
MIWRRLAILTLTTGLIGSASAQDSHWSGLAHDGLWASPNNWSPVGVPSPGVDANLYLDPANNSSTITITNGEVQTPGSGAGDMIYGPEFGAGLNVYGTLKWRSYLVPVQNDPTHPSIINLYSGAVVSGEGIALGDTWWYWGGPYVVMNLYGTAFAGINYLFWGGHVNLYGGTLSITNGLTLDTTGAVSDDTRSLNLAGGTLLLPGAYTATVNNWITRGILLAYGKAQDNPDIVIDTVSFPGRTRVTTVPLGGSLQNIHFQSFPTNVTLGVYPLTLLGDYPNVQNVVLAALDPAALPGTIAYQSSDPTVAAVDADGRVFALAPGTTTLTASLGTFTTLSAVTLTVILADPVPRLPQSQPVSGSVYLHDPGTLIKEGGFYFIYADGLGIAGSYSTDLRNWDYTDPVFPGNPPAWTTKAVTNFTGYFWAPDIAWFNGRYNLYYACSQWATINSAIGLVTTPSLVSPVWTDQGKVIQSNPLGQTTTNTDLTAYNCIDPSILVDTNGTVWMSFGSYSDGILILQLDPVTGKRISTNSPIYRVANNGATFFSNGEEASCLYQHGGFYYLFVNFGGCCSGIDSTYNIRVGRSTSVTGPYYDKNGINLTNGGGTMVLESTARFIGPGHPAILNDNGTNWFTYHYYDGNENGSAKLGLSRLYWSADGWPALTNDWSAFYPLNADAHEQLGLYDGTLQNGAAVTNEPGRGNVLGLDGVSQYGRLPNPAANASTFAGWVKWNGGGDWQRVFDFGNGTNRYLFLSPRALGGKMRFAITASGSGAEQQINAATAMPTGSWCHVAVTLDGAKGLLYLNGLPVGTNASLSLRPWQTLARSNYLGKSQWPDPLFNGEIGSFRVFGRALSGTEIRDLAWAHPALAHRYSFASNAWDSIGMAHGALQGDATVTNNALNLTGNPNGYVNLPGGLVSGSRTVSLEFWATFGASGSEARAFDFGDTSASTGRNYLSFSPNTGTGGQRLRLAAATTNSLDIAGSLNNRSVHVVCVVEPATGFAGVYTNGVLERAVTNSWPALDSVSTAWSFLGRSLFGSDAWLNATIDEFRIYDGRLAPDDIAADYAAGPDTLYQAVSLQIARTSGGYTLNWPSYAPGFALESRPWLGAGAAWTPVNGTAAISNGWYWLTATATDSNAFFRLHR